ncbi:hypothetical protein [Erythrobacter sp. MTPC3]|uniref:hypothetical protein n=1 Tax=Erythrobacter sp. MTPC3 TaxID=3056564 RepID=UPI0036F1FD99
MDAFLFTLILTFAIALGGRDQLIVGQFTDAAGHNGPMLLLGMGCAAASAAVMGFAGWSIAAMLPSRAADMLVAFALAAAGVELLFEVRLKDMKEPTRSYVAIAAVLFVRQLMDGARFVVFAFAAQAVYPLVTIIGGALGGAAAVALGWYASKRRLEAFPLRWIRTGFGACLIVAAIYIGLNARFSPL